MNSSTHMFLCKNNNLDKVSIQSFLSKKYSHYIEITFIHNECIVTIPDSFKSEERKLILDEISLIINPISTSKNTKIIYFFTVLVAFCSMIYEFLIAETMASLMGNTTLRYNITIGIYIASMGLGALLYKKIFIKSNSDENSFIKIELWLATFGFLSPILLLLIDYLFRPFQSNIYIQYFVSIANHSFIVIIGFITGIEIPLLIDIGKKYSDKMIGKILFFDYFGCFIGAIAFPLILLPNLNLFQIGAITAFLNIIIAFSSIYFFKISNKKYNFIMILISTILIWFYSFKIWEWLIEVLYVS